MSRNHTHAREQAAGYATGVPRVQNFLVIHNRPDVREIIGIVRHADVDPRDFLQRLAKEMNLPVQRLSILAEERPRTPRQSAEAVMRMEQQFEQYTRINDTAEEEDLSDFIAVYHRLRATGRPPKDFLCHALETYLEREKPNDHQDQDEQTEESWEMAGDLY